MIDNFFQKVEIHARTSLAWQPATQDGKEEDKVKEKGRSEDLSAHGQVDKDEDVELDEDGEAEEDGVDRKSVV